MSEEAFDILGYKPSPWQVKFHMSEQDEVLGAGSAGPGKTEALIHDPLQQVMIEHARCTPGTEWHKKFPLKPGKSKGHALYLRRASTELAQTITRSHERFPTLDPGARFSVKESMWTFSCGYRYKFGHCKDVNDYHQYYSDEFTWIGYDEATQFEEIQYQEINNRLRSTDPVLSRMLRIRLMSNPVPRKESGISVRNPHWVRDRFVKPFPSGNKELSDDLHMFDGTVEKATRIYLPARLSDNPDPVFRKVFEKNLRSNNPNHVMKALLEGDWFAAAGNFFECWDPRLHVTRPFDVPEDWPRFRAMDWGFKTHGVVGWFTMDEDQNLIMEREYTFIGKLDREVARRIREIEEDLGLWHGRQSLITGPADTQLWEERGDSAKSKASTMRDLGIPWRHANKKAGSRADNASRVYKRLMDHDEGADRPGLIVFDTCIKTIETLPGIQTDPNDVECPLKGGDDHWYDMIAYAVAFASHGAKGIPSKRKIREVFGDEDLSRRSRSRGPFGY